MQTRRLGRTDLAIAPIVLGGNVFGWTADRDVSFAVLDRFAESGVAAIDTADVYSAWAPGNHGGESETILGEWMRRAETAAGSSSSPRSARRWARAKRACRPPVSRRRSRRRSAGSRPT